MTHGRIVDEGYGERCEQRAVREPLELVRRDRLALLAVQLVEPVQRERVVQRAARLEKHECLLRVVVGHQRRLRRLLVEGDQAMDVLDSAKCLLNSAQRVSIQSKSI